MRTKITIWRIFARERLSTLDFNYAARKSVTVRGSPMKVLRLFQVLVCLFALGQSVSRACYASELKVVDDPSTGVRVSLPVDLLSVSTESATGRNWTTSDRGFNVNTIKVPADQTLESAFQKLSGLRGRTVSRTERSSEGFVLVGHDADGSSFYLVVQRKDEMLRGLSLVVEDKKKSQYDQLISPIVQSFVAFPSSQTNESQTVR
jgi:hypothetical protein